jgi:glycosyltransferase involved in cell wall biosynthesis
VEGNLVIPVTVLMAVWETSRQELSRSIESILAQTFRDFEFLIIDDGNSDPAALGLLREYAGGDSRIRVLHEPHRGLTLSLNRGLEKARGTFIARQDADDWSDPRRLERQFEFLSSAPAAVLCGSDAILHQQDGRALWRTRLPLTHAQIRRALERGNPFVHGASMFRASAARAVNGYRAELKCSQDYDFFWRLSEQGEAANLPEPLYHYRFSSGSISAGKAQAQALAHRAAQLLAKARAAGEPENVEEALAVARAVLEEEDGSYRAQLKQADHLMLAGEYGRAFSVYCRLLAEHPAKPLGWGKLLRLGVFRTLPPAREVCFR